MSKRRGVWIVEMAARKPHAKWKPTAGCGITRYFGKQELRQWREQNPTWKFRLVRYRSTP